MKLAELKNKFKNKFIIRIVAGVLIVAVLGSGATAYNVYAAKNTEGTKTEAEEEDAGSEFENDLHDMLSDNINVEAKEVDKEETVYVIADSTGKATSTIVSTWLKNPEGKDVLNDASDLKDITNVKGDETFTQKGSDLTWQADGSDIYYQGTTTKETPVTEKITYYLDDKEVSAQEIAGKSGKVKIRFDYTNNEKTKVDINGKQEEINVPFIVVSGMTLGDNFSNVEVTNGKVISNGAGNMVVGIAMPGLKESLEVKDSDFSSDITIPDHVEVTADVEDFSLDMTMSIVTSGSDLSVDGDFDLSDLDGKINDLTDAVDQLSDGSGELANGLQTLNDKMPEFSNGLNDVQSGVRSYTEGAQALADGIGTLKNSSGELISGVDQLKSSVNTLNKGVKKLNEAVQTGMSDQEKASAQAAAEAAVEAQFADDSNPMSYNNIKNQAAETFYATVANDANKQAAAQQAQTGAKQAIESQLDQIAQGASSAAQAKVNEQVAAGVIPADTKTQLIQLIAAGLAAQAGSADVNSYVTQATQVVTGIEQQLQAGMVGAAGSVAGETAKSVAGQVTDQMAGTIASTVVENVAATAKDQVGTSVADSVKTAAKTAAGSAAIQGAETVKATVASSINAKDEKSGYSLVSGMNELDKAVGKMADKMPALTSGIDQLYNGSQTLASNNAKLNDGIGKLVDGKNTMVDGVGKLASGSKELADGVTTFNEEGIEKLLDSYNGDLKDLVDRIQAVFDAGSGYESFSGKAEDSVSSVKFIIKTDAVKAEEE